MDVLGGMLKEEEWSNYETPMAATAIHQDHTKKILSASYKRANGGVDYERLRNKSVAVSMIVNGSV